MIYSDLIIGGNFQEKVACNFRIKLVLNSSRNFQSTYSLQVPFLFKNFGKNYLVLQTRDSAGKTHPFTSA